MHGFVNWISQRYFFILGFDLLVGFYYPCPTKKKALKVAIIPQLCHSRFFQLSRLHAICRARAEFDCNAWPQLHSQQDQLLQQHPLRSSKVPVHTNQCIMNASTGCWSLWSASRGVLLPPGVIKTRFGLHGFIRVLCRLSGILYRRKFVKTWIMLFKKKLKTF